MCQQNSGLIFSKRLWKASCEEINTPKWGPNFCVTVLLLHLVDRERNVKMVQRSDHINAPTMKHLSLDVKNTFRSIYISNIYSRSMFFLIIFAQLIPRFRFIITQYKQVQLEIPCLLNFLLGFIVCEPDWH